MNWENLVIGLLLMLGGITAMMLGMALIFGGIQTIRGN